MTPSTGKLRPASTAGPAQPGDRNPSTVIDPDAYVRVVTAALAVLLLGTGVWALLSPGSFADYVAFPEHEHFLHDLGAFQIGLGLALALAVLWHDPIAVALATFVAANTIHAVNHATDLHMGGRDSDPWLLAGLSVLAAMALARRLHQLGYVVGRTGTATVPELAVFVRQKTVSLTTYRRDQSSVATPVSLAVDGERAVFRTYERAWKTRRLARDPHVEIAPCRMRGDVSGEPVRCRARRLDGAADKEAARLLRRKHPFLHGVLVPVGHHVGRARTGRTVHFEVEPLAS